MTAKNNLCEFLEWDSDFFGFRIARLTEEKLTPETMKNVLRWCNENRIDCLYFLADAADFQTTRLAEKHGFHLTDTRITLETVLKNFQPDETATEVSVSEAVPEDVEQLKKIAARNHRDSRFYYDGRFPAEKCDELFALWIEKSCKGYADVVLTAKKDSKVQGYITCSIDERNDGSIGLVGVAKDSQGTGIGKLLINSAKHWFGEKNVSRITVVTQGRNVKAQRLYQNNGFITKSLKNWYHLWFV
jgi:Acetyltransferases